MLKDADGVSHHTVAEIGIGDRWVLLDPYFKAFLRKTDGRLLTARELMNYPEEYRAYRALAWRWEYVVTGQKMEASWLDVADFQRGTIFTTVPYLSFTQLFRKVRGRLGTSSRGRAEELPAALQVQGDREPSSRAPDTGRAAARGKPGGSRAVAALLRRFDRARRYELDGEEELASALYVELLHEPDTPDEIQSAARYWLAASAWRAGNHAECLSILGSVAGVSLDARPWREASYMLSRRCSGLRVPE
jgi:hypothetical protein